MNKLKGIEFSTGSLGMGLSLGIGVSISSLKKNLNYNTFVILGDGECNEGSVWESALLANQLKLKNLTAIIDKNNYQQTGKSSDILDLGNLSSKWKSFGWEIIEVNGHNLSEIHQALNVKTDRPKAIIANTTKGKGVSFTENNNDWHHNILTKKNYDLAIEELNNAKR